MRKRLTLALVLVLALMLTGCGGSEPPTGQVATKAATEAVTEVPTEAPTETTVPENPLALGRMEGGVYTNTYAGFGCTLDENWTFYSAAELQELPEAVKDMVEGSEIGDQLEGMTQLMDMQAENANDMVNVNVLFSKMDLSSRLAYQMLSEEEIIDATLMQYDQMVDAYAQAGIENAAIEKVQVTFLGEEHWAMRTTATIQGIDYYLLQVVDFHKGAYGITLSAASFIEDNTQAVLDLFYPIEQ